MDDELDGLVEVEKCEFCGESYENCECDYYEGE